MLLLIYHCLSNVYLEPQKEYPGLVEESADHPEILDIQLYSVTGLHLGLSCSRRGFNVFPLWKSEMDIW